MVRIFTLVPAAVLLVALTGCGPETVTTTGDQETNTEDNSETTQTPEERDPGGREPSGSPPPSPSPQDEGTGEEPSFLPDEPVSLGLGESHRFEDGFTVTMGPVERRTEAVDDHSDTTAEDGESPDDSSPEALDEDTGVEGEPSEESPEDTDGGSEATDETGVTEEDGPTEEATEEPSDEVAEETAEEPSEEASEEQSEEPGEEPSAEPGEEGSAEGDGYLAWSVEITNGTDSTVHTGSITSTCAVGDPLEESSSAVMGDAVNPPRSLDAGQGGSWDADCWADEEDSYLSWTLEFFDDDGARLYAPLHFSGDVA